MCLTAGSVSFVMGFVIVASNDGLGSASVNPVTRCPEVIYSTFNCLSTLLSMKVLIVDDEPAVQRVETRVLESAGFKCVGASTARAACDLLASEPFDVAVLDVSLGEDSGLTLARHIQRDYPQMVVIMVTGAADFTSVSDARLAGALDYLVKPVSNATLIDAVKRAYDVGQRRSKAGTRRQSDAHAIPAAPVAPLVPASREGAPPIDHLFAQMVAADASDLHLSAGAPPQMRVHGEMRPVDPGAPRLSTEDVVQLIAPIIPGRNRARFEKRHDSDFAYEIDGVGRFRANVFLDRKGMGAVFRRVPTSIKTLEQLGLGAQIRKLCALKKGLVLVTGPTGSGKSTTLAAMLDHINETRSDHIVTIEDPIEFVHENKRCLVNQREVHTHTRSFRTALRAALREDPDVVLIGEMRDLETVAIALQTAETGHLVLGSLHTTTAASTIDRIIDQFPASNQPQIRVMLAETLRAVIAQTLCRRVGGGRVAAHEVLIVNSAISNLIRTGKTHQIPTMMQVGRATGMVTLNDALAELVRSGAITQDEAQLHMQDQGEASSTA
jgi:twitching motility protein PilT